MPFDPTKTEDLAELRRLAEEASDIPTHDEMGCGLADEDEAFWRAALEAIPALIAEVERHEAAAKREFENRHRIIDEVNAASYSLPENPRADLPLHLAVRRIAEQRDAVHREVERLRDELARERTMMLQPRCPRCLAPTYIAAATKAQACSSTLCRWPDPAPGVGMSETSSDSMTRR